MLIWIIVGGHLLFATACTAHVLVRRKEPSAMMAWILAMVLIPYAGPLLYVVVGESRVRRRAHRRRKRIRQRTTRRVDRSAAADATESSPLNHLTAQIAGELCGFPPSSGNTVGVMSDSREIFDAIDRALEGVQRHVHLQYYIWRADRIGTKLRDRLVDCARAGVEVRLLLDSYGCRHLPRGFLQPLREAGGHTAWFLATLPIKRRWSLHLRNHRKLVIVDGQRAFVGSQNVGDEYLGQTGMRQPWYDCHLEVTGPVVEHLQLSFVEDWAFASGEDLKDEKYYTTVDGPGHNTVQLLATGPDTETRQVESVLFAAFVNATESVTIVTPYFVPSDVIVQCLKYASRNGVRVRIIHPLHTDERIVLWAGRSFYDELLDCGVEIWELPKGMLHAKLVIVDDRWACIGSTNMDIRSFRLNFEMSVLMYDDAVVEELRHLCDTYFARADRIELESWRERGLTSRLIEGAARLAAPML